MVHGALWYMENMPFMNVIIVDIEVMRGCKDERVYYNLISNCNNPVGYICIMEG